MIPLTKSDFNQLFAALQICNTLAAEEIADSPVGQKLAEEAEKAEFQEFLAFLEEEKKEKQNN